MLFRLHTDFTLAAPRPAVFALVRRVPDWPRWWRGCERAVELAVGGANGVGACHRTHWRSMLAYRVCIETEVVALEPDALLRVRATGDLEGWGAWRFSDVSGGTRVQYAWHVDTRRRWMHVTAPLLAPLFRFSHDRLMRAGAEGMARRLAGDGPPRQPGL